MIAFFRRNPNVIAYFGVIGAVLVSFLIQANATQDRKRQICTAEIEDRLVLRDIVDFAVPTEAGERGEAFRQYVYQRLEVPPTICEGTNVNLQELFNQRRPILPGETPTVTQPDGTLEEGIGPLLPEVLDEDDEPQQVIVTVRPVAPDRVDPPPGDRSTSGPPNGPPPSSSTTTTTTTQPGIFIPLPDLPIIGSALLGWINL